MKCPMPDCPYVDKPDFSIGNPCLCSCDYCPHGRIIETDATSPRDCADCDQCRAEDSEVPEDWFGAGFADNH